MRKGASAIRWARGQIANRNQDWTGYCQKFVRSAFGLGGGFPSAIAQWNGAKKRHPQRAASKIPSGVPVFWRGGRYGHVALSIGGGKCISTDARRRGWPDVVYINSITRNWGYELLGWTEDMQGVTIYTPPARRTPNITRALNARTRAARRKWLKVVTERGTAKAKKAAQDWLDAMDEWDRASKRTRVAKAALKKQERK